MTNSSPDLRVNPHHVRAIATAAELLSAVDAFEAVECAFGAASVASIRAVKADPHCETFTFRGVTFETAPFWRNVLILGHAAKPTAPGSTTNTLRPFAELIVEHGIRQVRLIVPSPFVAWLEFTRRGQSWARLVRQGDPPAREPPPTTVVEPRIPAPRPDLEVTDL